MLIALVDHAVGGGANGGTTSTMNTTGATLITLVVNSYTGGTYPTISDSKGNTYLKVSDQLGGTANLYRETQWRCEGPTVGSSHTVTISGTGSFSIVEAAAWSGTATSGDLDQQNAAGSGSNGNVLATGSVTPTQDNELIVAGVLFNQLGQTVSIDSGYTLLDQQGPVNSVSFGIGIAYKIQTSAAATNPTWTATGAADGMVVTIATFKVAAAGGSTTLRRGAQLIQRAGSRQVA